MKDVRVLFYNTDGSRQAEPYYSGPGRYHMVARETTLEGLDAEEGEVFTLVEAYGVQREYQVIARGRDLLWKGSDRTVEAVMVMPHIRN